MNKELPEWVSDVMTDVVTFLDLNGFEQKSDEILAVLSESPIRDGLKSWDEFLETEIELANAENSNVIDAADRFRPRWFNQAS